MQTRQKDVGFTLSKTSTVQQVPQKSSADAAEFISLFITQFLIGYGSLFCFMSGLEISANRIVLGITIAISILLWGIFQSIHKNKQIKWSVISVLYVLAAFFMKDNLFRGLKMIINQFVEQFNSYYVSNLQKVAVVNKNIGASYTVCLIFIAVLFCCILSYIILHGKHISTYLLLTIPITFVGYIVGRIPERAAFLCYVIGSFSILAGLKIQRSSNQNIRKIRAKVSLLMMLSSGALLALLMVIVTQDQYNKINIERTKIVLQEKLKDINQNGLSAITKSGNSTSSGGLSGGKLYDCGNLAYRNNTALKVTEDMDEINNIYLKGFVGTVYEDNCWKPVSQKDAESLDDIKEKYGIFYGAENIYGDLMNYLKDDPSIKKDGSLGQSQEIRVKNIDAERDAYYVPYNDLEEVTLNRKGYCRLEDKPPISYKTKYQSEDGLGNGEQDTLTGEKMESIARAYDNVNNNVAIIESYFNRSIDKIWRDMDDLGIDLEQPISQLGEKIRNKTGQILTMDNYDDVQDYDMEVIDYLAHLYQLKEFQKYENELSKVIYQVYTEVPSSSSEQVKRQAEELLDSEGKIKRIKRNGNDGVKEYWNHCRRVMSQVNQVKQYLSDTTSYSINPGLFPNKKDFVEYFLFDKKEGYCMHYASAAVILLREMGIPTRYVEGYIVTGKDMAKASIENDKMEIDIPDMNAHAWIEVYMDGYGWVPVEVTPAYEGDEGLALPEELENSVLNPTPNTQATATPENTVAPTASVQPTTVATPSSIETNGKHVRGQGLWIAGVWNTTLGKVILILSSMIILLILFVMIRYGNANVRRRKECRQSNRQKRLIAQYRHLQKILNYYHIQYELDQNYEIYAYEVEQCFEFLKKGQFKDYISVILQAEYGNRSLNKEQVEEQVAFCEMFKAQIRAEQKRRERWYCRYIKLLDV